MKFKKLHLNKNGKSKMDCTYFCEPVKDAKYLSEDFRMCCEKCKKKVKKK